MIEAVFPSGIYCICCGSMIDGSRPYALCDACARKIHWINERSCSVCGKALPDTYMKDRCYDCLETEHSFKRGFSCMTYGLVERGMILDCKYNGKGYMGRKFGEIMYDRLECEDIDADIIIPVPLSRERRKRRGYNQSEIMAREFSRLSGIPADTDILVRDRDTAPLRSMDPIERAASLEGAFSVRKGSGEKIKGKRILLIDDIYTTGATFDECSRTLTEAGAGEVYVMSLASGGNRRPPGV